MIQNSENIMDLLKIFYDGIMEFKANVAKNQLFITLEGDIASLKPSFISSNNAVYTCEALPFNENAPL